MNVTSELTQLRSQSEREKLVIGIQDIVDLTPFAKRTLYRWNSSGKLPQSFLVGGRRVWRLRDIHLWIEWGFPNRTEFEARQQIENLQKKSA